MPPNIETASLGWEDSLILMAMALVVFGPRRLPEIGRQIGKLMYELRKASNDFKIQIEAELRSAEEAERREKPATLQAAQPASAQTLEAGHGTSPATTEPVTTEAGTIAVVADLPDAAAQLAAHEEPGRHG